MVRIIAVITTIMICCLLFSFICYSQEKPHQVPNELKYKEDPFYYSHFGNKTDTLKGFFKKFYFTRAIHITWKYRPDISFEWKAQPQQLSASYNILDAWAPSLNVLCVAGITYQGDTVIEKWVFIHHDPIVSKPLGGGDPDFTRRLPTVQRTELYRGSELTHIADIDGDPQGRYLLLFLWEAKAIYRMDPVTGDYTYLFGPSEKEEIMNFRRITSGEHCTEGYIFTLERRPFWVDNYVIVNGLTVENNGKKYYVEDTVIFRDADKDGNIDNNSLEYLTAQEWVDNDYHLEASWK